MTNGHNQQPEMTPPAEEWESLTGSARKLCQILAGIVDDPAQFYLPEKSAKQTDSPGDAPAKKLDTKTLKDVIEIMKTLTILIRDLREQPDAGGSEITLTGEVERLAR